VSPVGKSHEKVHYEFRPAKQVERRMLLHIFQELRDLGYKISNYEYTGLGSIYFVDFVLFHRYLGLSKLTSVEGDPNIEKRVRFNRPYKLIKTVQDDMAAQIARLSQDRQHILWLDFDYILTEDLLDAVQLAVSQLTPKSILLVTVDVEPPGTPEDGLTKWNPTTWMKHYKDEASTFFWKGITKLDFARGNLPKTNARLIKAAIEDGLSDRSVNFIDMFSFLYADGHKMLSLGGMIGDDNDTRTIRSLDQNKFYFLCDDVSDDPYKIRVPLVTRKERLYLDQNMPCKDGWLPKDFEMKREDVDDYRDVYKYYPAYTETLL